MELIMIALTCSECGIYFGIPEGIDARRKEDGKAFYCLNGHVQYYGNSTAEQNHRLETLLAQQRAENIMKNAEQAVPQKKKEKPKTGVEKYMEESTKNVKNNLNP